MQLIFNSKITTKIILTEMKPSIFLNINLNMEMIQITFHKITITTMNKDIKMKMMTVQTIWIVTQEIKQNGLLVLKVKLSINNVVIEISLRILETSSENL